MQWTGWICVWRRPGRRAPLKLGKSSPSSLLGRFLIALYYGTLHSYQTLRTSNKCESFWNSLRKWKWSLLYITTVILWWNNRSVKAQHDVQQQLNEQYENGFSGSSATMWSSQQWLETKCYNDVWSYQRYMIISIIFSAQVPSMAHKRRASYQRPVWVCPCFPWRPWQRWVGWWSWSWWSWRMMIMMVKTIMMILNNS